MTSYLKQHTLQLPFSRASRSLFRDLQAMTMAQLEPEEVPVRFAVTDSTANEWICDVGVLGGIDVPSSIFDFHERPHRDQESFNVVMVVPTGIGAAVGGHAGDATPAATLLASVCDTLITHPNVLNASDIFQLPPNALYVEGSVLTQLMMGTVGLRHVRNNRLLVVVQEHDDALYVNAAINSVNAARVSYGVNATVATISRDFRMVSEYTASGSATGRVEGIDLLFELLDNQMASFDAVAITSVIELPEDLHKNYYRLAGDVVNPWGGIEALLTHAVSMRYGIPAAHAPMLESKEISEMDFGVVDPRMAAEVISVAFLQCVLRGLQKSPGITNVTSISQGTEVHAPSVSCLVIPDGCVGLPTLSALLNGIPVIAVKGNTNLMQNDLDALPWTTSQFVRVENYLEAAGVIASLRAGIAPTSILRPLPSVTVERAPNPQNVNRAALPAKDLYEMGGRYGQ